jgi:hypothetical protein
MKKSIILLCFCTLGLTLPTIDAQQLINSQFIGHRTKNYLQNTFSPIIQNGVDLFKVTYETYDVHGALDTASGLVVVPVRDLTYTYPLLCYQHGTVNGPSDVPSNLAGGSQLPMVYGGMGYIVSAADYLGLGDARGFHPYVHAATEASAAIDMLFAVRQMAEESAEIFLNDQLFITGYSQGGHGAAAAHKFIEADYSDSFTVTASAPMSGPYNISGTMIDFILDESIYYYPGYIPYTILSFNLASGLGYEIDELFKAPYVPIITQFYNREIGLSTLNASLISMLTANEGASIPKFIVQDSILNIIENEPDHPIQEAFKENDVYDWTPQAPTRLYYCMADDQVLYLNSVVADSVMNANGAADVMAIDVDPTADHGACVTPAMIQALFFFSDYQELTVDNEEIPVSSIIELTPNPAHNFINTSNIPGGAILEIFDLNGRLVLQEKTTGLTDKIDISTLSEGLYLLRATKDNLRFHSKLIKN